MDYEKLKQRPMYHDEGFCSESRCMNTVVEELASKINEGINQRIEEICAVRPDLLEQRENVTVWQKSCLVDPLVTWYMVTLNGEEVAKFYVEYGNYYPHFTIKVSKPIFTDRRDA